LSTSAFAAETKSSALKTEKQNRTENARARQLFRVGMNAYKAGRIEEARQLLGEAWEIHQSYDIAAILGQVEFELGNVVRANELLDYCLQNFPPIESDDKLSTMRQVREKARSQVAELEVHCDCSDTELLLDERFVGALPLTKPLYVQPGHHQLSLRRNGNAIGSRVQVEAQAGQRTPFELSVTPTKPAVAPKVERPVPATVDVKSEGSPSWPLYVGGGLVALNVAAAIGFKVASDDAADRAYASRVKLGGSTLACNNGPSPSTQLICSQFSDAVSEKDQYSRLTTYAVGAAATFAVATVAYWIWSKPATRRPQRTGMTSETSPLIWSLSTSSESAYLSAAGRF
jgi:hypothetical protein